MTGGGRRGDAIMPKDLHQVTLAATEAKYLPGMRVAAEPFLHLQRQCVHAPPHR